MRYHLTCAFAALMLLCSPLFVTDALANAPTAEDVYAATLIDTPATVVFEGSDADNDALTYNVVTSPASGALAAISGQTVVYTPEAGFTGVVTFTYKAKDSSNESAVKTATITVFDAYRNPAQQLGGDIDGEAKRDESGYSVSLSSDGQTVAIGAYGNDGNGDMSGHVRVYHFDGSNWTQLGADIDGEAAYEQSGRSVSLSSDGQTVAIGAPRNAANRDDPGHVRVYHFDGGNWTQLGIDIDGEAAGDNLGHSVSLSSDGQTVAIGAPFYFNNSHPSIDTNDRQSGYVRVYHFDGSNWTQLGIDIDGEAAGDRSGWSVSLSSDGQTVAIGAYGNDGNGGSSGHVRVYHFDVSNWTQLGTDINGEAAYDQSGYSVSLSSDGQTVAIGATDNDGNGSSSGHVRLYHFDGSNWTQLGADIDGEAANDYSGWSVSLSSDGQTVAIGARGNDGNGPYSGHVRVYHFDGSNWTHLGADIDGEAANNNSGASVSLSSDGQTVSIGASFNRGNDYYRSGHVRVYDLKTFAPAITGTPGTTATSDSLYSFTPTTSDPDPADSVNLAFSATANGGALPAWLSINSSTGVLSGTPMLADGGTLSDVIVSVSDGTLSSSLIPFDLNVGFYNVTPSAGANGSISPDAVQAIAQGATATLTVTPNEGYSAAVAGSCGGTLVGNTYTTSAITAACMVDASFTAIDTDGDGIDDATDDFPNAVTTASDSGVSLTTTPSSTTSSCSISALASTLVDSNKSGVANQGVGVAAAFTLTGCSTVSAESVEVSIDLGVTPAAGSSAFKVRANGEWQAIAGATIEGSVVSYTITDNGDLDANGALGTIEDPVTLAVSGSPARVPTLPFWGLLALGGLLGLFATRRLRRV